MRMRNKDTFQIATRIAIAIDRERTRASANPHAHAYSMQRELALKCMIMTRARYSIDREFAASILNRKCNVLYAERTGLERENRGECTARWLQI